MIYVILVSFGLFEELVKTNLWNEVSAMYDF